MRRITTAIMKEKVAASHIVFGLTSHTSVVNIFCYYFCAIRIATFFYPSINNTISKRHCFSLSFPLPSREGLCRPQKWHDASCNSSPDIFPLCRVVLGSLKSVRNYVSCCFLVLQNDKFIFFLPSCITEYDTIRLPLSTYMWVSTYTPIARSAKECTSTGVFSVPAVCIVKNDPVKSTENILTV